MERRLNEYQRKAVLDESDACLVNAHVGSGKTTVLVEKLRYLHEEKGISYRDMVVFTFTNKAAGEVTSRLMAYAEAAGSPLTESDLHYFGTFHSVAAAILRDRLPAESKDGYTCDFSVIDPEEELALAEDLIRANKLTIKYKNRLAKRLEQRKKERFTDDLPRLIELLDQEKRRNNQMNFRSLIVEASRLLEEERELRGLGGKPICQKERELQGQGCRPACEENQELEGQGGLPTFAPKWIVIDEVQDTDELQLEFIRLIRQTGTKLFAVGDPNQVIYSWRGSMFQIFYKMKEEFHATELSLPINYRSSDAILRAAGKFLESGNAIVGTRDGGDALVIRECHDAFQDAEEIADRILELTGSGVPFSEIAIFYRLQEQAATYRGVLEHAGIPCRVYEKKKAAELFSGVPGGAAYLEEKQEEEREESVSLMTLHASKGLEFSHVFIVGVNNGLIPLGSGGFEGEEEERRLFFVGITRAKDSLNLSCYRNPGQARVMPGPGRFLKALAPLTEDAASRQAAGGEDRKADLQSLRRQLREAMQGSGWSSPYELFASAKETFAPSTTASASAAFESSLTDTVNETVASSVTAALNENAGLDQTKTTQKRHPKYGIGTVVREDADMITVDFPGYGEKEFMKLFSELEDIG